MNLALPPRLADALYDELRTVKHLLKTEELNRFRENVRRGYVPNYDEEWAAFSYLYFGVNYLKTFFALKHLPTPNSGELRLLDLGCGAGASTAGAVTALGSWLSIPGRHLKITAVDRNRNQLMVYKRLLRDWIDSLENVAFETHLSDALDFLDSSEFRWDAVLCSYILEEQSTRKREALIEKLKLFAERGADIMVMGSSQASGSAVVEFLKPAYSSFPIVLENSHINLRKVPRLNREVQPMYAAKH